ncbi:substrate-binding periplasmic protein [Undibacterium sp. TJN19]|uniref:substrate-binding periplasmic protein n=1 Tax=Undibacterium sp. TJN19 TaxID=3413055 RepID=UPI003BF1FF69
MPRYLRLLACILFCCGCWSGVAAAADQGGNVVLLMSEELDGKGAVLPIPTETQEFFHYLERHTRLKFEVRRYPWKRAVENAASGEGLIFGMSKTQERLRIFKFSRSIFSDLSMLVTRCDAKFTFNSLNDLKGKTIGIVRGTSYGEEFDRLSNVLFKVEDDTNNNSGRFRKLYLRRMDAFLLYNPVISTTRLENFINKQYAGEFSGNSADKLFCILPKPVAAVDIHIAIRPDLDHGVMEKIDQAILQAQRDGELARIYSQENRFKP